MYVNKRNYCKLSFFSTSNHFYLHGLLNIPLSLNSFLPLSGSKQECAKPTHPISMKLGVMVWHGPRKTPLNSGADLRYGVFPANFYFHFPENIYFHFC